MRGLDQSQLCYSLAKKKRKAESILTFSSILTFHSGKSTLVNNLLGFALPSENRCTKVPTIIHQSPTPGTSAVVEFYTHEQFKINLQNHEHKQIVKQISETKIRRDCETYIGSAPRSLNGKDLMRELDIFLTDKSLMVCTLS